MTPRRFAWLLQTRGPALDTWPPADRAAALDLLRTSPALRDTLAEAWAVEAEPDTDSDGQVRIAGTVRRAVAPPSPLFRGIRAGALAACVAAGLVLGLQAQDTDTMAPLALTVDTTGPATVLASLEP